MSKDKDMGVAAGAPPIEAGHTRTPWRLITVPNAGPDGEPYWYIEAEPGARAGMDAPKATTVVDPECGILTEEDAAFIVRACNSYHALVAASRRAIAALEANGAPNCEAVKELRAALVTAEAR